MAMTDAGDIARMKRIAARIRERGVRVVFVNGWDQRGGTFPVVPNAAFVHHDASASTSGTWGALGIITHGRAGVPPPLSQFQVARGSVAQVAIVAAGIANHAGLGGPHKGLPKDNANRETYGTEVANNGVGEKYSNETIHAISAVQAAIAEESDFGPYMVIGHKEWAPDRKIDPTYSMDWMRELVTDTLRGDDMPLNDADKKWLENAIAAGARKAATEVMNRDAVPTPYGNKDNPTYKVKYGIAGAWDHAYRAQKAAEQSVRQLATLAGQIAALEEAHRQQNAGEPVDYGRVTAAAEAGARAAIESSVLDVDITVNDKGDVA